MYSIEFKTAATRVASQALCIIAMVIALAVHGSVALAAGETRTLSLYNVKTKESVTDTYMKDGKYIPSIMKKIDYILRDWRANEVITISPRTIDLMWELHSDLGSQKPIHIMSGYRSSKTNKPSEEYDCDAKCEQEHSTGHAIDFYFPDVPAVHVRNSALVREVGGLGYYPGDSDSISFIHIDSGPVRYWGPSINIAEMANIMRDYRRTVGARLNKRAVSYISRIEVAESGKEPKEVNIQDKIQSNSKISDLKRLPLETQYTDDDEELASMTKDASSVNQATSITKPSVKPYMPRVADPLDQQADKRQDMTVDKVDADNTLVEAIQPFIRRIQQCWVIPPGAREGSVNVKLAVSFNADGSIVSQPVVLNNSDSPVFQSTSKSLIAALFSCEKFDMLPEELKGLGNRLEIEFSPQMFSQDWPLIARLVKDTEEPNWGESETNRALSLTEICKQSLNSNGTNWNSSPAAASARLLAQDMGVTFEACRSQIRSIDKTSIFPMTRGSAGDNISNDVIPKPRAKPIEVLIMSTIDAPSDVTAGNLRGSDAKKLMYDRISDEAETISEPNGNAGNSKARQEPSRSDKVDLLMTAEKQTVEDPRVSQLKSRDQLPAEEARPRLRLLNQGNVLRLSSQNTKGLWRSVMDGVGRYIRGDKCWLASSAQGRYCLRPAELLESDEAGMRILYLAVSGFEVIRSDAGALEPVPGFESNVIVFLVLRELSPTKYELVSLSDVYVVGGYPGYPPMEDELDFLSVNNDFGVWSVKSNGHGAGGVMFSSIDVIGPFGLKKQFRESVLVEFLSEMNNFGGCGRDTGFICQSEEVSFEFVQSSNRNSIWPDLLLKYEHRTGDDESFGGGAGKTYVAKDLQMPVSFRQADRTLAYQLPTENDQSLLEWFKSNTVFNGRSITVRRIGDPITLLDDVQLCRGAYNKNIRGWDESSAFRDNVLEAQRRGLSAEYCAGILN